MAPTRPLLLVEAQAEQVERVARVARVVRVALQALNQAEAAAVQPDQEAAHLQAVVVEPVARAQTPQVMPPLPVPPLPVPPPDQPLLAPAQRALVPPILFKVRSTLKSEFAFNSTHSSIDYTHTFDVQTVKLSSSRFFLLPPTIHWCPR